MRAGINDRMNEARRASLSMRAISHRLGSTVPSMSLTIRSPILLLNRRST